MARIAAGACLLASVSLFAQISRPPSAASNSTRNAIGLEFVRIQPGEFTMGCSAGDNDCTADERPAHEVRITKPFEIGKYEVTQAEWKSVMGSNPSANKSDDRPVENVTRPEAMDFLARLNEKHDGYKYRLPTEAEWEYAARAGAAGPFTGPVDEIAWHAGNSDDESHPVGKKKPNAWGLFDMQGNVREWVADLWAANYYSNSPREDPAGPAPGARGRPNGPGRGRLDGPPGADGPPGRNGARGGPPGGRELPVMRGGGWDNPAAFLRVSSRYHYYGPTLRVSDVGFRTVREPIVEDR